jgi:DNA primase
MAGRIPQSFINELLARADLVDVIDRRVPLKKKGHNFSACCPFHNEKTPSFSVNPDKQFYYCFGCGASGNALTFLMEYEGQEFVAAIEDLASQMAMEVPREAYSGEHKQPQHNHLYPLMEKVSSHFQLQLKSRPEAKKAIEYLKNRGLSGEIAKQYGIGYASAEWQNLTHLDSDNKQLQKDLVDTGMMIEKDNGHAYDRFRDRIMFPIRNRRGQVLGFGGRVIDQGEPKYLNSPETKLFHKGKELYGLYEMRRQLRQIDHVIIVEGYMDVVALAQYGIYNAAATLGTATTSDHLHTLFRICPKVVFCFDGDRAGRAAALRALNHALPLLKDAREVRMMFLPDGEDPDSMVRNIGADAFKQQVEHANTLFEYLFEHLTDQVDMNTFEGPAQLVHLAKPFWALIEDAILRVRFQQRLSELSGLSENQLLQVLPAAQSNPATQNTVNTTNFGAITKQSKTARSAQSKSHDSMSDRASSIQTNTTYIPSKNGNTLDNIETRAAPINDSFSEQNDKSSANRTTFRRAIALVLQFPDMLPAADINWLDQIDENGAKILTQLCQLINNNDTVTTAILIEHWRQKPEEKHLLRLATQELHIDADNVSAELCEIFKRLEQGYLIEQCDYLIEKSKTQMLNQEEKETLKRLLKSKISHN